MPLINTLIDLYSLVVLAAVILSWVPQGRHSQIGMFVASITEPVLAPIRRALPPMGGLDLSPMVLLIALRLLRNLA